MRLTLVRNATLIVELGGKRVLVDPALDDAGARPPIENTANPVPNPTVPLPMPAEDAVAGIDAVIVTHRHRDHLDAVPRSSCRATCPSSASRRTRRRLRELGLDARPVETEVEWDGIAHRPYRCAPRLREGRRAARSRQRVRSRRSLHRRRHRLVRGRRRDDRTPPASRCGRECGRRGVPRGRADHHGRRRRP